MPSPPNLPAAWQPLFDALRRLRQNWVSRGWSWDNRLSCITSSFSVHFEADARVALANALPTEWTSATLPKGPPRLRTLAEQFGDIRTGQLLLTGGSLDGLFAFGLWWPWGNGQTISLRVGLADVPVNKEPYPSFRELFGVEVS